MWIIFSKIRFELVGVAECKLMLITNVLDRIGKSKSVPILAQYRSE